MVKEQPNPQAKQDDKATDPVIDSSSETKEEKSEPKTVTPEEQPSVTEETPSDDQPNPKPAVPESGSEEKPEADLPSKEIFQEDTYEDDLPEEVIIDIDDIQEEDEYTPDERSELEARYAETMKVFRSGELVMGKIVAIGESDVAIDIGFKSEGSVSFEEFEEPESLSIGDEVEVCIDSIESRHGSLILSKKKAEFQRIWEKINNLYLSGEMVEAQIVRRIKGGMVVDLFGVEAFLPGSQIDVHPVRDFDALVNANMDFRIIKVNNARKNVVLSHKVLVEESLREIREKVLSELEEGQVVEGVVKNITDFGVFVDLGGVDGLLHITDLSWGRVSHPSDVVSLDEKIAVKVLHYDKEKRRISLGLKQLKEHHWDEIEEKYPINSKVKGKVVSIVKYGAFVELEEGVEGLVHISEMSWTQHIKHPSQMVNVNDEIEVVILNIDRENRKVSLGMKQVEEDPWERLEQVFLPGTKHTGIVRDLVPFGAFVELDPGIDGLVHISDLSWTRKVRHPGEIVKKGQEIEVVILNFDKNERRIALGFKQLEDDPWDTFEREYTIRAKTEGSVIRVLEKGVVVMLSLGVEGFIPNSQLGKSLAGDNKKKIKEGDNIELEVIEFDKNNHRIVLSHSSVERTKDRDTYRTYSDSVDETKTTIGDIVGGAVKGDEKPADKPKKPRKKEDKKETEDVSSPESLFKEDKAESKGDVTEPVVEAPVAEETSEPTPEETPEKEATDSDKPEEKEAEVAEADSPADEKDAEVEVKEEKEKKEKKVKKVKAQPKEDVEVKADEKEKPADAEVKAEKPKKVKKADAAVKAEKTDEAAPEPEKKEKKAKVKEDEEAKSEKKDKTAGAEVKEDEEAKPDKKEKSAGAEVKEDEEAKSEKKDKTAGADVKEDEEAKSGKKDKTADAEVKVEKAKKTKKADPKAKADVVEEPASEPDKTDAKAVTEETPEKEGKPDDPPEEAKKPEKEEKASKKKEEKKD